MTPPDVHCRFEKIPIYFCIRPKGYKRPFALVFKKSKTQKMILFGVEPLMIKTDIPRRSKTYWSGEIEVFVS